ncbi:hypothetical protein I350_05728 [Cryptococcus amylolentus CBS 6273]|uniref:Uncharacterized protein n=1 Tax=Cryptococcus amylolentus CBS 6273 TaxID=1296118 RepID=A0A1E3JS06_9TREE|nr:hypothetical protein I350_05728 [Cryptococcus amylolentus CBS 6273]
MSAFPKVYTVNGPSSTSASALPSWLAVKTKPTGKHKKRTKTQHTVGDLELIQDFKFPGQAIKIKTTEDGLHAIATGTYKPMMKVWDLEALTVKFERVTDAENVDFVILSQDWTKSLHLQRDRSLQLHTQMGLHHTVRLPIYGRALGYHSPSADALIGATGNEVFRFNLEEGRYMTPLRIAQNWGDGNEDDVEGVNVVDVNPRHGLWSFGLDGGGGVVEFWDPRSRSALTRLVLPAQDLLPAQSHDPNAYIPAPYQKLSVSALASHPTDGLSFAVGTSTGHTLLYDLRSPTPFAVKDQGYSEPIRKVDWLRGGGAHEDGGRVVSSDSKVIKIWDKNAPADNQLSLHPPASMVDLHPVPQSGLMFVACDAPQLSSYYIPDLGPAPKWASFLDSVTEELGDDFTGGAGKSAYADYKFIDKHELETLGLTHLIGTPALKPYMHGYFLSLKLYTTARLIANPQSYDEHRDRIVNEKLKAKSESRIRARKEQPKVNKALAERIRKVEEREKAVEKKRRERREARGLAEGEAEAKEEEEEEEEVEGEEKAPGAAGLLSDPRFKELWDNPDFEVDEESREFALINPATANNNAKRAKTAVEDEEEESDKFSSDLEDDEESEEGSEPEQEEAGSDSEESDDGNLLYDPRTVKAAERRPMPRHKPTLVSGDVQSSTLPTFGQRLHSQASKSSKSSAPAHDPSILAMRKAADGGMEMSFIPSSNSRSRKGGDEDGDDQDEYSGGTRRKDRVERFGAGMEKGGREDEEFEDRGGRTQRRRPDRSASKNAFRRK